MVEPASAAVTTVLQHILGDAGLRSRIVHVQKVPARHAVMADPVHPLTDATVAALSSAGISRLYSHQALCCDLAHARRDFVVTTGPASGKSLCYLAPILDRLAADPRAASLLIYPTKALAQDQYAHIAPMAEAAGIPARRIGVYDGDTGSSLRRTLRDEAVVLITNPDMLHAALMPQHQRWHRLLSNLQFVVVDELHTYGGALGSNSANLMRRLWRLCATYGSYPLVSGATATIGNPIQVSGQVLGRDVRLVDDDGSPAGEKAILLWNPPRESAAKRRSRRSAMVEAAELMALLLNAGVPTIAFSKAKMTAELLVRYLLDGLGGLRPGLGNRLAAYRGGLLAGERREVEAMMRDGRLLGISTTPALEVGIDIGGLDAAIVAGYPGTLASFNQQIGRAGRRGEPSVGVLVGLDTTVNQWIMRHPEYLFGRPVEALALDPANPFVVAGHLRCAAQELPVQQGELAQFGPSAGAAAMALEAAGKLKRIGDTWYHSSHEIPQHEVPLRGFSDGTVVIEERGTHRVVGELNRYDAQPIVHPGAVYMHQGETYIVEALDMDRNIATVRQEDTSYYTQPVGGTDIHHIDRTTRRKPFGTGLACWGEVTATFQNIAFERIPFGELEAISSHGLDLPVILEETVSFWLIPPESLMRSIEQSGLNPHNGLRGIGYATRMLMPLFVTCDTSDFSHSVGAANSPWHTLFVYERYPNGLGFTARAFERLHQVMPAVLAHIRECPCRDGCPHCVGKPLRQFTTWNVERGEAGIPCKAAAIRVLDGLLGDQASLDSPEEMVLSDDAGAAEERLVQDIRRQVERRRSPMLATPVPYPAPRGRAAPLPAQAPGTTDAESRRMARRDFGRRLRARLAEAPAGPPAPEDLPPPRPGHSEQAPLAPPHPSARSIGALARERRREAQSPKDTEQAVPPAEGDDQE